MIRSQRRWLGSGTDPSRISSDIKQRSLKKIVSIPVSVDRQGVTANFAAKWPRGEHRNSGKLAPANQFCPRQVANDPV